MTRRRSLAVTQWDDLPPSIIPVAKSRIEPIKNAFATDRCSLSEVAESCYLQGVNDTATMLFSRFPNLFGVSQKELPPFEIM